MTAKSHSVPRWRVPWAGAVRVAGGPVGGPSRPRHYHPVVEAVGATFGVRDCLHLVGMRGGQPADLGECRHGGVGVKFRWWFPHVGIAVDDRLPAGGAGEIEAKRVWCAERMVVYFGPDDTDDKALLREIATKRRQD